MTEWQMGIRAFQEGRLREAVDRLRTAAAEQDRTVSREARFQTYAFLGSSLYALGNATGATEAFISALTLVGKRAAPVDLLLNLANSYLAAGRRNEAQRVLTETLDSYPGAMEASMLLERLQRQGKDQPLTGAILGESPDSVKHYLSTLSFGSARNGYSPDQVNSAISQIERYIDVLSGHLASRDETVAEYANEIERLRQSEESLIDSLMQARAEIEAWRRRPENQNDLNLPAPEQTLSHADSTLSPLEKLFQKKA